MVPAETIEVPLTAVENMGAEPPLAAGNKPATSAVARLTAELVTVCVEPAKCARPTPGEDATMQVVQVIVPVEVIVPPPIGVVVATLVTVPLVVLHVVQVIVIVSPRWIVVPPPSGDVVLSVMASLEKEGAATPPVRLPNTLCAVVLVALLPVPPLATPRICADNEAHSRMMIANICTKM